MANLQIEFFSNCLHRPVQFKMILPNDYSNEWQPPQKRKGQDMKTLFLLHGYTGSGYNWAPEEYCSLYNMAIVMPNGENGFWIDGISTGHAYGSFLGEELVGYIRKTFGLCKSPEDTFIMGFSMGGYGALRTALAYPEVFGRTVGLSNALVMYNLHTITPESQGLPANYEYYRECFGDLTKAMESRNNPEVLVKELLDAGKSLPKIYLAVGTEDFLLEANRRWHGFLEDMGVEHEYYESAGGHDGVFWGEYARKLIPHLFDDYEG